MIEFIRTMARSLAALLEQLPRYEYFEPHLPDVALDLYQQAKMKD